MATFQYKAHRADQKLVEGQVEADDLESARRALEEQGLIVSSIQAAQGRRSEETGLQRQVDRVLANGKYLAPALQAYAQELPVGKRRSRLQRIADQLEQGHGPSGDYEPGQLDAESIQLRILGATSDDPSQISSNIVDEFQREDDLRGKFASAIAYPLVMFAASLAVLLFITIWIVPTFKEMFLEFEIQLPASTNLVLGISYVVQFFWWAILIVAALLAALLFYNLKIRNWIVERIPIVGSTIRLADQAKLARHLADLLDAEMPIPEVLPARQLPNIVIHTLQMDALPHAKARILRELSWMYDQQTRNRLSWLPGLIEPLFIVLMGIAVGFYVVALFMPLVSLIQGIA